MFPAKVPQESLKKIRCDDAEGKFVRKITADSQGNSNFELADKRSYHIFAETTHIKKTIHLYKKATLTEAETAITVTEYDRVDLIKENETSWTRLVGLRRHFRLGERMDDPRPPGESLFHQSLTQNSFRAHSGSPGRSDVSPHQNQGRRPVM
ncbi:MAG: hypothetical protein ACKVJX_05835 [Verrucomicrobiia bacterium]